MTEQKVVAFVGMPGAGKGTCTDYLSETYNWPLIHFGNMVYEEVQRRGLHNVNDEKFVRKDMRDKEGPEVLAKHVAKKVNHYFETGKDRVVLDGLYSWTEYKYLQEVFGDKLVVIAVAAPRAMRHQRVVDRKDGHRTYTLHQIITREIDEIENLEKGGPIANADYTIVNDKDPYDLLQDLNTVLKKADFID